MPILSRMRELGTPRPARCRFEVVGPRKARPTSCALAPSASSSSHPWSIREQGCIAPSSIGISQGNAVSIAASANESGRERMIPVRGRGSLNAQVDDGARQQAGRL